MEKTKFVVLMPIKQNQENDSERRDLPQQNQPDSDISTNTNSGSELEESTKEADKMLRDESRFHNNVIGSNVTGVSLDRIVCSPLHTFMGIINHQYNDGVENIKQQLGEEFGSADG